MSSSSPGFSGVRVSQSVVFCARFCVLIIPLVSASILRDLWDFLYFNLCSLCFFVVVVVVDIYHLSVFLIFIIFLSFYTELLLFIRSWYFLPSLFKSNTLS